MKILLRSALSVLISIGASHFANAANVECLSHDDLAGTSSDGTVEAGTIRLIGRIEYGDYQRLVSCWEDLTKTTKEEIQKVAELNEKEPGRYATVKKTVRMLVVSSNGGLLPEAMKIGRFARSKRLWVIVPDNGGTCFSSCVYILAAGVIKWPWGEIGIHRPYFLSPPNQSYDSALKRMLQESEGYFKEMNIPAGLAEDMFSIPPETIKLLGDVLLSKYRLNQADIAYAEEGDIRNALAYGLSRQDYMARMKLQERYNKDCVANLPKHSPTAGIVAGVVDCSINAYKRAGLVLKN